MAMQPNAPIKANERLQPILACLPQNRLRYRSIVIDPRAGSRPSQPSLVIGHHVAICFRNRGSDEQGERGGPRAGLPRLSRPQRNCAASKASEAESLTRHGNLGEALLFEDLAPTYLMS